MYTEVTNHLTFDLALNHGEVNRVRDDSVVVRVILLGWQSHEDIPQRSQVHLAGIAVDTGVILVRDLQGVRKIGIISLC